MLTGTLRTINHSVSALVATRRRSTLAAPAYVDDPNYASPPVLVLTWYRYQGDGAPHLALAKLLSCGEYYTPVASLPIRDHISWNDHVRDVDPLGVGGAIARRRQPYIPESSSQRQPSEEKEILTYK